MERVTVANVGVCDVTMGEAVALIDSAIAEKRQFTVIPVNTDMVVKMERDAHFRDIVARADLVLADGQPIIWLARLAGTPLKEKVSGSDLANHLCALAAARGYTVFVLGGRPGVAELAARAAMDANPGLRVCGTYSPPMGFDTDPVAVQETNRIVSEASPDILLACFGAPRQEKYLHQNARYLDATALVCAGATVDFLAGTVRRAPRWMRDNGLEWFHRFCMEPRRLFRRYFVDDAAILRIALKYWRHHE